MLTGGALGAGAGACPRLPAASQQDPAELLRAYSPAALADHQPRVTDLLPSNWMQVALLIAVAAVCVAGIELVYLAWSVASWHNVQVDWSGLDLAKRGSLADWFASLVFALASLVSVQIYHLRRHRIDDYRGQYRVWSWAAVALLAASVNATTGVAVMAAQLAANGVSLAVGSLCLSSSGGNHGPVLSSGWWVTAGFLCGWLAAMRLAMEMRRCAEAIAALIFASVCYVAAFSLSDYLAALTVNVLSYNALGQVLSIAWSAALAMTGHVSLLVTTVLFARHVFLDAQGRLTKTESSAKKPKSKKRETPAQPATKSPPATKSKTSSQDSSQKANADVKSNQENATAAPVKQAAQAPPAKAAGAKVAASPKKDDRASGDDLDSAEDAKLSKSERRRLRKERRRNKAA